MKTILSQPCPVVLRPGPWLWRSHDQARLRTGRVPENMAVIRHMALDLLQRTGPTMSLMTAGSGPAGTPIASKSSSSRAHEQMLVHLPWRWTVRQLTGNRSRSMICTFDRIHPENTG
jgi:hypothetical protein